MCLLLITGKSYTHIGKYSHQVTLPWIMKKTPHLFLDKMKKIGRRVRADGTDDPRGPCGRQSEKKKTNTKKQTRKQRHEEEHASLCARHDLPSSLIPNCPVPGLPGLLGTSLPPPSQRIAAPVEPVVRELRGPWALGCQVSFSRVHPLLITAHAAAASESPKALGRERGVPPQLGRPRRPSSFA